MGGSVLSRLIIVGTGLLYPGYSSYKAVSRADVKLYVRWMMYWIVFAIFSTVEVFADVFISWLPLYYEVKVIFILWLVTPYTRGSTFLYKKFIHPNLKKKEQEIDLFLESARERSYQTMVDVGSRGLNIAANAVVTAAVKGQAAVTNRIRSYSVTDVSRLHEGEVPRRQALSRRMTCDPLVRVKPLQSVSHSSSANPLYGVRPEYTKAYSMMDIIGNIARDMPSSATEPNTTGANSDQFQTQTATFTIDDMHITRTGAEPIPESDEFPRYYTMPRTRGGNRNGQVTLECDKRERWKNSTQSSIGKGQRGSHRLDSLV